MSIEIKKLSKSYFNTSALKNINLNLIKNEVIGLLGPNGAGKTTLLKILTGALGEWSGHVKIGNLDLRKNLKKIQKQIGYLPENNPLYPEMFVREYLMYVGRLYQIKNPNIEGVIEKTGLSGHQSKKINFLSKGFKQRVGIAAALLHDPKYLILDEPTTGLDPNQLIEIRKLIQDLGKKKIVLLSTHILQEVEATCQKVIIIHQGEIVLYESLSEIGLNQKQIISVSFDYRVENIALSKIPNCKSVVNTSGFEYELTFNCSEDKRPDVFDFAHENGLKILNLYQKNDTLEKRFNSLTGGSVKNQN